MYDATTTGHDALAVTAGASPEGGDGVATPILRTAAALLSVQGITWLTSLTAILIVPRFLGPFDYGRFAVVQVIAMIVVAIAKFGTSNQIVKAVARAPGETATLFVHAAAVRLSLWAVMFCGALLIGWLMLDNAITYQLLIIVLLGATFGLVADAAGAALHGNYNLGRSALVGAAIGIGAQAATIFVLIAGGTLIDLALVGFGTGAIAGLAQVYLLWTRFGGTVVWNRNTARTLITAGGPFLAWDLALLVYGSVDYVMLSLMTDAYTVGQYAFAYRLVGVPVFVPTIASAAIYPVLARTAHSDPAAFRRLLTMTTRAVLMASLPMVVGLQLLSSDFTRIIGGGGFADASVLMIILAIHMPLVSIDTVLGYGLFSLDRQRSFAVVGWIAAALNPALNVAAIPLSHELWGNGAIGAASVTVLTECFLTYCVWRMMREHIDSVILLKSGAQALAACAAMSVAVLALHGTVHPLALVPVGAAVYVVAAFVLRLVSVAEVNELRVALLRRPASAST